MPEPISRREFAKKAAVAGGSLLAATAAAQKAKKPTEAELLAEADLKSLESKLEKPLPPKLKDLAKKALATARNTSKERLKFKLPEGSEPCTAFAPEPARNQNA